MSEQQELTGTEVARVEEGAVERSPSEGVTLIERLIDSGSDFDVEVVERLVALQERQEERAAEAAMNGALAAFQAECPLIIRTAEGHNSSFAPYEEIVRVVRPLLSSHGLSFTHDSRITDSGQIEVTCTLRHEMGATRTSTFTGPSDNSGGKNALQAFGSSRSYGKRYSLSDVLGIATEEDDDGQRGGGGPRITDEQADELDSLADEVGADKGRFFEWMSERYGYAIEGFGDIAARDHQKALNALERKRQ